MSILTLTSENPPTPPGAGKTALYASDPPWSIASSGVQVGHASPAYNYLRNSGFWYMQRGPGTFTNPGGGGGAQTRTPTLDGWCVFDGATGIQVAANAVLTSNGISTYGSFTKITNAARMVISQQLEGTDSTELRGRTVRLSFWARAIGSSASSWRVFIVRSTTGVNANTPICPDAITAVPVGADLKFTATGGGPVISKMLIPPRSGITPENGTVVGNGVTMHELPTSIWQRYGAVFDIPTTVRCLAIFIVSMEAVAIGSGIALANAQLTVGAPIRPWMPLTQVEELRRVQRYYSKSFSITQTPAQNAGLAGAQRGHVSVAGAVANQPLGIRFPVPMIDSANGAIITFYNPSVANAFVHNTVNVNDATATAAGTSGDNGMDVIFTGRGGGGAWAAGEALAVHYTMDRDF